MAVEKLTLGDLYFRDKIVWGNSYVRLVEKKNGVNNVYLQCFPQLIHY